MKLRIRLALAAVATAIPVIAAFTHFTRVSVEREVISTRAQFVTAFMQNGGREECESAPSTWLGALHPQRSSPLPAVSRRARQSPKLYGYDASFSSSNPNNPVLDSTLIAAMRSQKPSILRASDGDERSDLLLRMPWTDGPCAFVLVRDEQDEMLARRRRDPSLQPVLATTVAILVAIYLALGPVIRRIRRLERDVRRSAADRYKTPIKAEGNDEIAELGRAFEDASQLVRTHLAQQQQREQTLRDFLANTTHDVNTPLTVLIGHLSQLEKRLLSGEYSAPERTAITAALREAHYMASLLHNLGIAAKLDAGEPEVRRDPIDLGELVQRCVARHRPFAERTEVAIEAATPEDRVLVSGDMTMIEQAVSNLMHNAIRYNHPQGHVAVVLEVNGGEEFSLRVLDDGPGMSDEDMSRAFERHFRGNRARTRNPSGKGLGLNIAQRVAELHDFGLRAVRSELGGMEIELSGPIRIVAGRSTHSIDTSVSMSNYFRGRNRA